MGKKRDPRKTSLVFNLDLHIGVVPELSATLASYQVHVVRYSLSNHNHLARHFLTSPDPVAVVNQRTWQDLSSTRIERFRHRYEKFLRAFDGFVLTHTPAFFQLLSEFEKPTLIVSATRYETPFTHSPDEWEHLNKAIISQADNGNLTLVANNQGDADYIRYFTGLEPLLLPSLCERKSSWNGSSGRRIVLARDMNLKLHVESVTGGRFTPSESLGAPYTWNQLMSCIEVFVVPQNISTMTLFELATAGVPVAIPSRILLKELRLKYRGVLDELTYAEVQGLSVIGGKGGPVDWEAEGYLDWWLDRADFYNKKLMPNIRQVDSLQDLILKDERVLENEANFRKATDRRNHEIAAERSHLLSRWAARVARSD